MQCSADTPPQFLRASMKQPMPEQLAPYLCDGCLLLWPTIQGGEAFHSSMYAEAKRLQAQGQVGNNLLSSCPGLDAVLDAPEVVGVLTALLGDDYALSTTRHCHISQEGSTGQTLHQDSFFGFERFRHAAPMDIMLMYYPQAVSPCMG